ncbi:Panacea domain-containing protein [Niabella drilacis]|uniref:Uncharacterized phage-associated protein n=1 Tax=Niabella drilacis (strain DSM 25811 / CCM 8410 / CCUG 62505 / LMG 26954 / E90) TaxID=1285928 RepID=A0A1G6Q229_NIADE|nr:Panacea domain-containing protein [Niabella drilacis]SDC86512.1 Uncharacterized phage-associated protein [Niabella drilacis]
MMTDFPFNKEKAIASMLHICNSLGGVWDKYSLLKILYFAEQKHLARYARPITGDNIIAMEYGPVPSISYDEIKYSKVNPQYFSIEDNVVVAKSKANTDVLSDSDLECLDESIAENKHLSFGDLKKKSHDAAYNWTVQNFGENQTIPYTEIAKAAGASENMIAFIKSTSENFNFSFDE